MAEQIPAVKSIGETRKREVSRADEKYTDQIRAILSKKGLSRDEIQEIINLVYKEEMEYLNHATISTEALYEDIARKAGPEWREITELVRITGRETSPAEIAAALQERFPNLEVKVDPKDYVYSPVKVRTK